VTSAPWRLLLPVLLAVGLVAGPSNRVLRPATVDVQAAQACWTYFGFSDGPLTPFNPVWFSRDPPAERLQLTKDYKKLLATVHIPSAQDVRQAVRPLRSTTWAELGAQLAAAADTGQTGQTPQDEALQSSIDHACNQLSIAAKIAGGWKPSV